MSLERISDDPKTPWWGEHRQRYEFALDYIGENDEVLDIACGTGFGTFAIFLKGVRQVIGGDVDGETIELCRQQYEEHMTDSRLAFERMDITNLKFEDESFDVVVSFETLEHVEKYEASIQELHRVLKNGGKLLLSTPNSIVSSPEGKIENPFHIKEFTLEELEAILRTKFSEVTIGGQIYVRYNNSFSLSKSVEWILYQRGVRKLSLGFKNRIMRILGQQQFYPESSDYEVTFKYDKIIKSTTLVAVCTK